MINEIEIAPIIPHDQGIPEINGPAIYGASPGKPFFYAVPVRGARPLKYTVRGKLPDGLKIDETKGFITGKAAYEGEYPVTLVAKNESGIAEKRFLIRIKENELCLTPLLGWTSWNAYAVNVTRQLVENAADAMVSKGLVARGYAFINTDSCWQSADRGGEFRSIVPNDSFPNMADMVSNIHAKGLKAGIYSTPMVTAFGTKPERQLAGSTFYPFDPDYFQERYGGCGKTGFEENDARQWTAWEFDYLKYDWPRCDIIHAMSMSRALRATGRDFIYSLTTGCRLDEFEELKKSGNMFRSNRDTFDTWERILGNILSIGKWPDVVGPGHWYDLDMLALGEVQIERDSPGIPSGNRLTRNEAITHFAVWAFLPSPLQLSCNLDSLDDFTLALVSNEELLAINQDELGICAKLVKEVRESTRGKESHYQIYARELVNGDKGFALINIGETDAQISLNINDYSVVRDVLAQKNLSNDLPFSVTIPPHGTRVFRCSA